jgi:hypothetical protein
MNEIEILKAELQSSERYEWALVALSALANPLIRFVGTSGSMASATAGEIRSIYEIRLAHLDERGIWSSGLRELLSELRATTDSERISAVPFRSDARTRSCRPPASPLERIPTPAAPAKSSL